MRKLLLLLTCCSVFIFSSCVKSITVNPDKSVSLVLDTLKLTVGTTNQLISKNYAINNLVCSVSDTSIISVSASGLVTAKKIGQSSITISNKTHSVTATCLIIVLQPSTSGSFTQIPAGKGSDIGIGADSAVYIVGADTLSTGGHSVFQLVGNTFVKLPDCGAVRVAVSPQGLPWVITQSNLILRYNGTSWDQLPGTGTDIGIGADGSVFIIGTLNVSPTGGFNIMKWNGTGWDTLPECAGVRIAVSPQGIPWVVNKSNIVYQYTGNLLWNPIYGVAADDIGIGADGSVYVTGLYNVVNPPIYKYSSNGWIQIEGITGINISVSPQGKPWWTDNSRFIFKLN
ncbi:Ig-like protein group 2 [Mucilaginibacter frigoritolerans]|uniref:Ig-like protein group 2 n=1 Tax=Mucilaginibacter frigoritolerans TaxID=652788 RepID=A0A562U285_9SPHI|nr:tectonin domain-containing protein [Mucilaginibacter frigoritolerans]TWI99897.1 Ig-like protein group 2 [Mucilaginibacter frigoritolerans]